MQKFIYVFDEQARDLLLARGFLLLGTDPERKRYVFVNQQEETFALDGIQCVQSSCLTFTPVR